MKNKHIASLLTIALMALFTNCRPANIPDVETIAPNETAFLVPLEGDSANQVKFDSEEFLEKNKISIGRVEIPKRWRSTGYTYLSGEHVPLQALIKVNRAPVTVQWQCSTDKDGNPKRQADDDSIWIESKDSVGFSIGFNVSAYIEAKNAAKFLYMYAGRPLKDVLNTEVRGRIMEVSQTFASKEILDILREKKAEMSLQIQTDVTKFFETRGITITNVGLFGGFTYENPNIQQAIDNVFVSQQLKNKTKAELDAQTSINEKLVSEAKAKANAALEEASGKAEASVKEAEGRTKAIEMEVVALEKAQQNPLYIDIQRLKTTEAFNMRWDGKLPANYIGSDNVTSILGIPDFNSKKP